MSYTVETSGELLLPEHLERQALTVVEVDLAARQGAFDHSHHVDTLRELAAFVGADVRRDGDWLKLTAADGGDRGWSDQATAFYVGLGRLVHQGEVHLVGQDGARWSYRYGPDGVIQIGQNGWDGSLTPFGAPMETPTTHPPGASSPPGPQIQPGAAVRPGEADPWADPEPRNRTVAMTLLFLFGIVMIVGIAMLGAGLFG